MTQKKFSNIIRNALLCGVAAGIAACALDTPTQAPQKRVRLQSGPSYKQMPAAATDEATLRAFAEEYRRFGSGPVELTVSYDPRSRNNTALNASEHAARIAASLRRLNVPQVSTAILPVNMLGEEAQVMMRYESLTARAPEGCTVMGGVDGYTTEVMPDYEYGCTVESLLARQIARPADLAGRGGMAPIDGRRTAIEVEGYRTGATP